MAHTLDFAPWIRYDICSPRQWLPCIGITNPQKWDVKLTSEGQRETVIEAMKLGLPVVLTINESKYLCSATLQGEVLHLVEIKRVT